MNIPMHDAESPAQIHVHTGNDMVQINYQKDIGVSLSGSVDNYRREVDESVVIPDEDPVKNDEDEAEIHRKQQYYGKMNEFALSTASNKDVNFSDISVFNTLYTMGFKQFSLNLAILKSVSWSIDAALDKLMDEN